MSNDRFFISATGTDTGKTFVTASLALLSSSEGIRTAVMKPIQTGIESFEGDYAVVKRHAPMILDIPEEIAVPQKFKYPSSPHLAAELEGRLVDMNAVRNAMKKLDDEYKPELTFIEGAGGLLVPLIGSYTNRDFIKESGLSVILVTSCELGSINYAMLSVECLKNSEIPLAGIVFNKMPDKPSHIEEDNVRTIVRQSGTKAYAVLKNGSPETAAAHLAEFLTAIRS